MQPHIQICIWPICTNITSTAILPQEKRDPPRHQARESAAFLNRRSQDRWTFSKVGSIANLLCKCSSEQPFQNFFLLSLPRAKSRLAQIHTGLLYTFFFVVNSLANRVFRIFRIADRAENSELSQPTLVTFLDGDFQMSALQLFYICPI